MSVVSSVPPARCLCGGVKLKFRDDAQPLIINCFCTDCSTGAGGPLQCVLFFDEAAVTVEDPEKLIVTYENTDTVTGKSKPKYFCGRCGCTLFTKPANNSEKTIVRASLVEGGCNIFKPTLELFTRNRPSFISPVEGAVQRQAQ